MIVYCITNTVNGKKYVGASSSKNEKKRWREHLCAAREENPKMLISRKMKQYGVDSFVFEVLERVSTVEELRIAEQKWIKLLDTYVNNGKGYNRDLGGNAKTEEQKKEISEKYKGREVSGIWLERIRVSAKRRTRWYVCVSPDGEVSEVCGLREFCEKHGLLKSRMNQCARCAAGHVYKSSKYKDKVYNKINLSHRGWKCFYKEDYQKQLNQLG